MFLEVTWPVSYNYLSAQEVDLHNCYIPNKLEWMGGAIVLNSLSLKSNVDFFFMVIYRLKLWDVNFFNF